jgi:hypothetical protein
MSEVNRLHRVEADLTRLRIRIESAAKSLLEAANLLGDVLKSLREVCAACASAPPPSAREDALATAIRPLAALADAYDNSLLDEVRPEWVISSVRKPDAVALVSGRGGKELLTLGDAFKAREALYAQPR